MLGACYIDLSFGLVARILGKVVVKNRMVEAVTGLAMFVSLALADFWERLCNFFCRIREEIPVQFEV